MGVTGIAFASGRSREGDILAHLQRCDTMFSPPLSGRVDLRAYAAKLAERAARFEAWHDATLVGLVAVYCDGPDGGEAFVSSVSVDPSFQRNGVARQLLQMAADHVRRLGFNALALEVDRRAAPAIRLYETLGFRACAEGHDVRRMRMAVKGSRERM